MVKVEVFCIECDKFVAVKAMKITKEGRMYLTLKCGHDSGFIFAGIIYPVQERG